MHCVNITHLTNNNENVIGQKLRSNIKRQEADHHALWQSCYHILVNKKNGSHHKAVKHKIIMTWINHCEHKGPLHLIILSAWQSKIR